MKKLIGFSTNNLSDTSLSLKEKISLLSDKRFKALEIGFSNYEELSSIILDDEIKNLTSTFDYLSLHAPNGRYEDNKQTRELLFILEKWVKFLNIQSVVLHPDGIDNFDILASSGIPFCLENMDHQKKSGTHPEYFLDIFSKYPFGFILDVQHTYERDSSMNLAKQFISLLGNRLKHMHVSGCSRTQLHVPVYLSDSKTSIESFISSSLNVPYILEGILDENIEARIEREFAYIS